MQTSTCTPHVYTYEPKILPYKIKEEVPKVLITEGLILQFITCPVEMERSLQGVALPDLRRLGQHLLPGGCKPVCNPRPAGLHNCSLRCFLSWPSSINTGVFVCCGVGYFFFQLSSRFWWPQGCSLIGQSMLSNMVASQDV